MTGIQYGKRKTRRGPTLSEMEQAFADYASPRPAGPPSTRDPAWGVPICGAELVVGDTIVHLGRHYPVDRIVPYTGALKDALGAGARTACSGSWGIAIGAPSVVRILPRATS